MSLRSLVLASFAAVAVCASAHASTFDLSTVSSGTTPTFSITSGGVTATFTSPTGNGFAVQNTAGLLSFNIGLVDNNFFGPESPLTITFSSPVAGNLLIPFGFTSYFDTSDSLTVVTNTGQTATYAGAPDSLALGELEGNVNLALNAGTTSVTLSGTDVFAIGNVSTVTPEPASIVLLATGLAGVVARRRRVA